LKKLKNQIGQLQKEIENWEKKKLSPKEMFEKMGFSQFDDKFIPLFDLNGKLIEKKK